MTSELLAIELDAAEQDVLFSRTVLETAKARLAIDVKRLEAVQARIARAEMICIHGRRGGMMCPHCMGLNKDPNQ